MKKLFYVWCCIVFLVMVGCSKNSNQPIQDTLGHSVTLASLQGKWVIINFWAGWCEACREEIPDLNSFNRTLTNTNVILYGVNYDGLSKDELINEMEKVGMQFPNLLTDPGWEWGLTNITVLPTTFIISPKGQVIKRFVGVTTQKSLSETLALLQKTF